MTQTPETPPIYTAAAEADTAPLRTDFEMSRKTRRNILLALFGFLLLRLLAMKFIPMIDTTESRYAEIARKMVETGNWITPQFDYGVPFWGKPPLHSWLSALGLETLGVTEFAARLPIFLTSLLALFLVYRWSKRLLGRNAALIVALCLTSMGMFFAASAIVMTDMPMALGCIMVMIGYWNATHLAPNAKSDLRWGLFMFLGLAIGLLAKGPVATVLCVMPIGLFTVITWRWSVLKRLPWLRGCLLLAGIVLPWYIAAEIATPGFLRYFIIGEHFERFVVSGWDGDLYGNGHARPKGMIWLFWLATLFPWTFALVVLCLRPVKLVKTFTTDKTRLPLYLALWMIAPMILFTPAANILPSYVLPGLPAAAMLGVIAFGTTWGKSGGALRGYGMGAAVTSSFLLFLTATILAGFFPEKLNLRSQKALVATARALDPDAQLYIVGGRSYSGDFYSQGTARSIDADPLELAAILTAPEAAYLAVSRRRLAQVAQYSRAQLVHVQDFGPYILFTHPAQTPQNSPEIPATTSEVEQ